MLIFGAGLVLQGPLLVLLLLACIALVAVLSVVIVLDECVLEAYGCCSTMAGGPSSPLPACFLDYAF